MNNPLFILHGNGTYLNRGCEAIFRSTVSLLLEEFGPCRFINTPVIGMDIATTDPVGAEVTNVIPPVIPRNSLRDYCQRAMRRLHIPPREVFVPYLGQSAATLALGGDNYSLDYGVPMRFLQANRVTLKHGKPLILWGASIGPFTREPAFEKVAADELKRVTLICARESETIAYLESLGVKENVRPVSDPAFLLKTHAPGDEQAYEFLKTPSIGLNLSPLAGRYSFSSQEWLQRCVDCARGLLEQFNQPLVLIPHVTKSGSDDQAFLMQVYQQLADTHDRIFRVDPSLNCHELKWVIARLAVFIGARTHATIAALSGCVPTLSIGYSIKARGINQDIFGHDRWLLPAAEMEKGPFLDKVSDLVAEQTSVRKQLQQVMPGYQQKARDAARFLKEVL